MSFEENACQLRFSQATVFQVSTIIGIATIKGGAGKSTIAANTVGWLSSFGYSTILVDCDEPENRTSSNWIAEDLPQVPIAHIQNANELRDQVDLSIRQAQAMICQVFMPSDVAVKRFTTY